MSAADKGGETAAHSSWHCHSRARGSTGLRLGYSQVANPIYLMGKGTMSPGRALPLLIRNLLANVVRSVHSEPWVDRRGRLKGNLRALADLVSRRLAAQE